MIAPGEAPAKGLVWGATGLSPLSPAFCCANFRSPIDTGTMCRGDAPMRFMREMTLLDASSEVSAPRSSSGLIRSCIWCAARIPRGDGRGGSIACAPFARQGD